MNILSLFSVYLFLRDRERQNVSGGGQRERETQNPKQAPGSSLPAVSTEPNVGLEPTSHEILTRTQVGCFTH